jgi:hypothetical protein
MIEYHQVTGVSINDIFYTLVIKRTAGVFRRERGRYRKNKGDLIL